MATRRNKNRRVGGVYLAVLATALVVSLLGMSAIIGQRIQNRLLVASTSIRQAQLNANAAIELGLLIIKQDPNWRANYSNGNWFVKRTTGAGTCTLNVTDPNDSNLSNNPDDPVAMLGIGYSGEAEQRVKVTVDPWKEPLGCLRSGIATGDSVSLSGDILRTNGRITANSISANSSQVYGKVEAVSVGGSTYDSPTTQITSDKRPTMPDWTSVFNYYRTNGTQIDINSLPTTTPNLGRNPGIESGSTDWTGTGTPVAVIQSTPLKFHSGTSSLSVQNRSAWNEGAAQYVDSFIKPGQQYTITGWVYMPGLSTLIKNFRFTLFLKGTSSSVQQDPGPDTAVLALGWRQISATLTAPTWSGNLEYAFIKIAGADSFNTNDFYFDDLTIREVVTGRLIYRQVLSPSVNPFSAASTNAEGIYWIDCNGTKLTIERSRILGTLLVINPGANSCIGNGPISWSPAVAGYPALLVQADSADNADFSIYATNRALSEKENSKNYNPAGAPHDEFGQDNDTNDIYRSAIQGLVAIQDDLVYGNRSLIRGEVIVGDDVASSSGELEVEYRPDSLLNPPPGFWSYTYKRRPVSVQKAVLP